MNGDRAQSWQDRGGKRESGAGRRPPAEAAALGTARGPAWGFGLGWGTRPEPGRAGGGAEAGPQAGAQTRQVHRALPLRRCGGGGGHPGKPLWHADGGYGVGDGSDMPAADVPPSPLAPAEGRLRQRDGGESDGGDQAPGPSRRVCGPDDRGASLPRLFSDRRGDRPQRHPRQPLLALGGVCPGASRGAARLAGWLHV